MTCPDCNSSTPPTLLGNLGPSTHLRCRDCGAIWAMDPEELGLNLELDGFQIFEGDDDDQ